VSHVDASTKWQLWIHEYINKLLKAFFKIRQSKITLNQTLTIKLGVTLVLTVTQVYDFINPRHLKYCLHTIGTAKAVRNTE